MLSCKECGHDCTEKDFERRINLCDHLHLDALAKQTETKGAREPVVDNIGRRRRRWNQTSDCVVARVPQA